MPDGAHQEPRTHPRQFRERIPLTPARRTILIRPARITRRRPGPPFYTGALPMPARLLAFALLFPCAATAGAQDKKENPQEAVLRLTNEYRVKNKLAPLKANDLLMAAAQKHADNMARKDQY